MVGGIWLWKQNVEWTALQSTPPDQLDGGWNGFSTLAEFYDLFEGAPNSNYVGDGQEERRGWVPDATNADETNLGFGYGFLIGQQYSVDGEALKDRAANPLVFTKELPGLVGNNERTRYTNNQIPPCKRRFYRSSNHFQICRCFIL